MKRWAIGCGATAIVAALVPLVWWNWLEGKRQEIESRAAALYGSAQTGELRTDLLSEESVEGFRAAEREHGPVEAVTEVRAYLQGFGVSGGATVQTKRGGKAFRESYATNDETTPLHLLAVEPLERSP